MRLLGRAANRVMDECSFAPRWMCHVAVHVPENFSYSPNSKKVLQRFAIG